MKKPLSVLAITVMLSCSAKKEQDKMVIAESGKSEINNKRNTNSALIPLDGQYTFTIAFAEWQGKSMGEKVKVILKGDSIKVIYEGAGALTAEKGEILDEGVIMKHKSGNWIIAHSKVDVDLDEVGGCTGGPAIIDFEQRKYWMC
ncbi:MAG: hypothetical protein ACO1OQ_16770 [Rufibacter sp.]